MALQEQQELGLSDEGPTWHNLLGSQNWEDLLDPLNDELRRLIIQCGDFCQVTYDTFINDPNSAYCGSSRYAKSDLLKKTAFPGGSNKYDVVGFLYATARVSVPEAFLFKSMSRERWDRESNWIGYIAVSNDQVSQETGRREIYVAWRGTTRNYEWINVLGAKLQSAKSLLAEGCHGHSLGATLSVLSAFDIAENVTREIPVSAIIFGCPKVGNKRFKERVDAHPNLKTLHVRNVIDTIPLYPARLMGYVHIGIELEIDSRKSPFLKASRHVGDWHNLQAMLHIVNGWQGFKEEFRLVVQRSIALVNKSCDYLKEECLVPPSWWVEKNKGMVLSEQGEWVLAGPEEIPVPEYD
uniref:Phospholipase A1 n=1 Tax=Chenopodium quinoa TaxID=63459 RepID=A0A803N7I4_CHEQI